MYSTGFLTSRLRSTFLEKILVFICMYVRLYTVFVYKSCMYFRTTCTRTLYMSVLRSIGTGCLRLSLGPEDAGTAAEVMGSRVVLTSADGSISRQNRQLSL